MPSWPSPTRTPAARNASSGNGSRVPGATVVTAMSWVGEQVDQRRLPSCVDGREGEGMADGHPAGHPERGDPFGDQLERERAELAGLVEVDVDADLVALGEPEHGVEMSDRVAVEGARVDAADEVGAGADGRIEEIGRARVARMPDCGKATSSTRQRPACASRAASTPSRRSSLQSVSTWTWLRTSVAPEAIVAPSVLVARARRRPPRPCASCARSLSTSPASVGSAVCGRNGRPEPRRVEVGVDVGERREQHATATVDDRSAGSAPASGADRRDQPIAHDDVDRVTFRLSRPHPDVAQQEVAHTAGVCSPIWARIVSGRDSSRIPRRTAPGYGSRPDGGITSRAPPGTRR